MRTAVPFLSEVKDRVEVLLDNFGLGADVAASHVVKRHLGKFSHAVGVSRCSKSRGIVMFTFLRMVSFNIDRAIGVGSYQQ